MTRMRTLRCFLRTTVVLSMLALIFMFAAAMKTKRMMADVWQQLGISQVDANVNIKNSFIGGHLQYYGAKNAKNILVNDRVAIVNQLVEYSKKYFESEEFRTAYKTYREKAKPVMPEHQAATWETAKENEKFRLEQAKSMAEFGLKSPNEKTKQDAAARMETIRKEMAAIDDPNNPNIKKELDALNRSLDAVKKMHDGEVQRFNAKYPEDPKQLLKKRLQEILAMTATVDYAAEVKEMNKKMVFVNPVYERKPADWKLAYRAGKVTTDAVRAAAQKWLDELK